MCEPTDVEGQRKTRQDRCLRYSTTSSCLPHGWAVATDELKRASADLEVVKKRYGRFFRTETTKPSGSVMHDSRGTESSSASP